jgi:hypothetical protein
MGIKERITRLEGRIPFEEVALVTDDGEEIAFRGDPLDLVVEQWSARVEGRPVEHPLAPYLDRGLCLKRPERVSDPVWRMLGGPDRGARREPLG